jgi:hypothetical protein
MSSGSQRSTCVWMAVVVLVTVVMLLTPAGAHVTDSVSHLWTGHIKPLATKLFYTKSQSDGRFVRQAAKKTGYASCPAAAFQEDSNDQVFSLLETGMRYDPNAGGGIFACNAALPHGATIKALTATFLQQNASENSGAS